MPVKLPSYARFLLPLDFALAKMLGAPDKGTLSGYAWDLEQRGRPAGKLARPVIDWVFRTFWDDENHCRKAFNTEQAARADGTEPYTT